MTDHALLSQSPGALRPTMELAPILPLELILSIIEKAFYERPGFRDPDYQTLLACSLVHSSWATSVQTLIFRHVTYKRGRSFSMSYHLTGPSNPRSEALLSHLRILEIGLGSSSTAECTPRNLLNIISRLPYLYELSLHINGIFSLRWDTVSDLRTIATATWPGVRALRVLDCSVQSPILYELLSVFPTVQFLTIGTEMATPPITPPIPGLQLYELVLFRTLPSEILTWLLANSTTSLHILELRDLPGSHMPPVLEKHGPHIRALRLMRYNAQAAAIVRICTNLAELIIMNIPQFISLPTLPPSLEHFGFVNQAYVSSVVLRPVIEAINKLPNLRTLSCDLDPSHDGFLLLEETCAAKHITMRTNLPKLWIVSLRIS